MDASLYAKPNDPMDFADKLVQLIEDDDLRHRMEFSVTTD